jgi:hypothetical protein
LTNGGVVIFQGWRGRKEKVVKVKNMSFDIN